MALVWPQNVEMTPSLTCLPAMRSLGSHNAAVTLRFGSAGTSDESVPAASCASRNETQLPEGGNRLSSRTGKGASDAGEGVCTSQSLPMCSPPSVDSSTPRALAWVDGTGELVKSRQDERESLGAAHHDAEAVPANLDGALCDPADEGLVLVGGVDKGDLDAVRACELRHLVAAVEPSWEREDVDVVERERGRVGPLRLWRGRLLEVVPVGCRQGNSRRSSSSLDVVEARDDEDERKEDGDERHGRAPRQWCRAHLLGGVHCLSRPSGA